MLQVDYYPEGTMEKVGDVMAVALRRVERDLAATETGAWRGEIKQL
jgi:hypothetical protein